MEGDISKETRDGLPTVTQMNIEEKDMDYHSLPCEYWIYLIRTIESRGNKIWVYLPKETPSATKKADQSKVAECDIKERIRVP